MQAAGPERPYTQKLVAQLEKTGRKNKAAIWIAAARRLKSAARRRPEVNLTKLNKLAVDGKITLIPGKLLSLGHVDKAITVAAFAVSKPARAKVEKAGGKVMKIDELLAKDPKGSKVTLVV